MDNVFDRIRKQKLAQVKSGKKSIHVGMQYIMYFVRYCPTF